MLTGMDPLAKLVTCLIWLVAAMLVLDPAFQAAAIALFCVLVLCAGAVGSLRLALFMIPFALFGFGILTTTVLFRDGDGYALAVAGAGGTDAMRAGLALFLRAIACGAISIFFAVTTDPGALVKALIARARLPAAIGYGLFAALQLVPDLREEVRLARVAEAMRRGRAPGRLVGPIAAIRLVVPLLAFAIRRAGRTALVMEARGFVPGEARTMTGVPRLARADLAIGAAMLLLLVATLGALG